MGNNSEVSKLVVDKEWFKKQLEERINAGEEQLEAYKKRLEARKKQPPVSGSSLVAESVAERFVAMVDRHGLLDMVAMKPSYEAWDDYNIELLEISFDNANNKYKRDYIQSVTPSTENIYDKVSLKINILRIIAGKIPLLTSVKESSPMDKTQVVYSNEIFVVHGHNNAVKHEVARFITVLGLTPIILDEQANAGKTIIEKFEHRARNAGFAVILLTDDDIGESKNAESTKPRARQNVIFEYGYFVGRLGRNRTCQLYKKGLEMPSDLHGVVYSSLEDRGWQIDLAKELKAAGYEIDLNKLL